VRPPADEELLRLAQAAPPMRGLEYLDAHLLERLWRELAAMAADQAAKCKQGPAAFLSQIDPLFHQVGRVTFHLAENKREPQRPFAFLATYAHRVSERAKVAHLPLGEAVKASAGARDRAQLATLLAPVERAAQRSELVRELLAERTLFAPQAWTIRQAHRFLHETPAMEEAGLVVRVPNWWSAQRPPRPQVQVRLGAKSPSAVGLEGLLEFDVELSLDGDPLTEDERRQLLSAADGMTLLRGKWVEVDPGKLQQALDHWKRLEREHARGIDFIQGMRLLAGADLGDGDEAPERTAEWSSVVAGDWLRDTLAQLRQPGAQRECQPGRDLQATLRPYQVAGVQWLWLLTQLGLGGCLADDMGLGKTIQVIDLLLLRKRAAGRRPQPPNLLVVPASLLGNWRQELARFGPSLSVRMLHRSECDAETLDRVAADPEGALAGADLAVTTYGLLRRQDWLQRVHWSLVILDEAQAIKNAGSRQTRTVKELVARSRLVLTGTPVENHLGDLWSLFDFACPGLLGTANEFKKYVKRLNSRADAQAYAGLRRLVRPYILRRLKTDPLIAPDLPEKTELQVECGLSKKQAALYERAVAELARRLEDAENMQRRGLVLAALMQLKQICNHPAQALGSDQFPPQDSGKFERLRLLCQPIAERQERALVFTQFRALTEPLAEFLKTVFGRPGLVLDGSTAVGKRSKLVEAFQAEDGPPFFVISLKAGGSGLNLTAASHVIHFDRWWNPAVENQATDRAFRIGQRRNVLVHKFVCRGTVEERIDELIRGKQALASQVLDQEPETPLTEMADDELLRFVALDLRRALDDE
jgi:non-specific serine/threonine protein kinase